MSPLLPSTESEVRIPVGRVVLEGNLVVPDCAAGVVLFAHGSGSGRHSHRNRHVAYLLQQRGLATLLLDLLSGEEEDFDIQTSRLRFDVALLAERLLDAADWLEEQRPMRSLPIGSFGSSTGAAAALMAAAERPHQMEVVVSRGGRPDLAGPALAHVESPTLLLVGGHDTAVVELNRRAYEVLTCEKQLEIIPNAGHLFEEPGALDEVARLAGDWFIRHLPDRDRNAPGQ